MGGREEGKNIKGNTDEVCLDDCRLEALENKIDNLSSKQTREDAKKTRKTMSREADTERRKLNRPEGRFSSTNVSSE